MNKIKNLFVIILFALVAFSCSDILDKGPLDKYSENDVWKSTDLTQAFIYTALANATNMMVWKDNWTDNEAIMEDGRDVNAELIDRYYDGISMKISVVAIWCWHVFRKHPLRMRKRLIL